jgi:hypothetical protein
MERFCHLCKGGRHGATGLPQFVEKEFLEADIHYDANRGLARLVQERLAERAVSVLPSVEADTASAFQPEPPLHEFKTALVNNR